MPKVLFAGVEFKNPVLVASGPLTSSVKLLQEAERHGAAGASTKLTMRHPPAGQLRAYVDTELGMIHASERRLSLEEGVRLIEEAKATTSLKLFANITSETGVLEEWVALAEACAKAGADFIEANLCCPMIGLDQAHIGKHSRGSQGGAVAGEEPELVFRISRAITTQVSVPLVCKLTPTVPSMVEVAVAAQEGGAKGIAVFGGPSLVLPPLDLERGGVPMYPLVEGACYGFLAGPSIKYASYKRVAEVKCAVSLPVIGSGGISSWRDAVEMMMWGADLVGVCASVMMHGFAVLQDIVEGIERYLQERNLDSYSAIVGAALRFLRPASEVKVVPGYAVVDVDRCVGCGRCARIGHCSAISLVNGKATVAQEACIGCGMCYFLCPYHAIKLVAL